MHVRTCFGEGGDGHCMLVNRLATTRMLSHIQLFATPCTVIFQVPWPTEFPRQEYWSGLPFPPLEGLPDPGTEPESPASLALAGWFFSTSTTLEVPLMEEWNHYPEKKCVGGARTTPRMHKMEMRNIIPWSPCKIRKNHENRGAELTSVMEPYQFSSVNQSCLTLCDPMRSMCCHSWGRSVGAGELQSFLA